MHRSSPGSNGSEADLGGPSSGGGAADASSGPGVTESGSAEVAERGVAENEAALSAIQAEPQDSVAASESTDVERQSPSLPYLVVAFGASAGGLQAVRDILAALPADTGMSFVLITHLSPDHKSYMAEILSKATAMPVVPIEDGEQPLPNQLHVLTPNFDASLENGCFRLHARARGHAHHLPIDVFFRSLAADQKNFSIGVVLSGGDSDGALGLKTIKGEGGIALVQAPDTAQHSSMPRNSIAADHVDLVLAPAEISGELQRLAEQFSRPGVRHLEESDGSDQSGTAELEAQYFARILQMLRTVSGLQFRLYKEQTLRRRVARRMVLLRLDTLADYLRFLQGHSEELRTLQEEALINVTRFFRDPEFWEAVKTAVLPVFCYGRPPDKPIRIWSAGCSTGEEAFSFAIIVLEYLAANDLDFPVQIFGTDASDRAIDFARLGLYPESIAADVSPERLRRYFIKRENGYQISRRVRDTCIFARQNLSGDPPFSHIDLLSCRNVMIYFQQVLQHRVIGTFHYALESGGYLLLGMSESLREFPELFDTFDRKNKIYSKIGGSPSTPTFLDSTDLMTRSQPTLIKQEDLLPPRTWPDLDLQHAADRIVLTRFAPAGLVIDEQLKVLQVRGQAAPFIELPSGVVDLNMLHLLRPEVVSQVRERVEQAVRENIPISIASITLRDSLGVRQLQVDVLPIGSVTPRPRCFLVLFQPSIETPALSVAELLPPDFSDSAKPHGETGGMQLRTDLDATRLRLHLLLEERDAHNQELVSANKEIQSANEELQSSNEELETTKEELQSSNEELQTVNEELHQRNFVLLQTGNDLTNLLNSVNIPLLMLTSDLKIRQFTPPMQRLMNIRPADVGRSISEIRLQLSIEDIEPLLVDVLETLNACELEVTDRDGRWHMLRIRPYRTAENRIEGLVVVLVDIHQLRSSQQELSDARDFSSTVVESVPVALVVLNSDCTIRTVNTAFRDLTRLPSRDLIGRSLPDLAETIWGMEDVFGRLLELMKAEEGRVLEFEHISTTARKTTLLVKGQAMLAEKNQVILLTIEDITARRAVELLLSEQQRSLEARIEIAGRTLVQTKEELRGLTAHLFNAQEEERQRVARELHDDVSQRLSLLAQGLEDAEAASTTAERHQGIDTLRAQLQSLNSDVRQISHRLHPSILNDLGLTAALRSLVDEFGKRETMPVTFVSLNVPKLAPQLAVTALYRITQEALRNVVKHAGKTHVKVMLEGTPSGIHLEVLDLGQGFDLETDFPREGLGLVSMKERARLAGGQLRITSALGRGTTVTVDVPLEGPVSGAETGPSPRSGQGAEADA